MSSRPFTTADIPRKYLKSAMLVGAVPFKASTYDQRASYCMYVPEKHYMPEVGSSNPSSKLPLIVTIHGTGRRAEQCRDVLVGLAESEKAAVLAPMFPAGVEDPNDIHNYKTICYKNIRYDNLLLSIIDEVSVRWPGIETTKFFLIGFSGGGQFCLRFLYLRPNRLEAVSIGSPGRITHLDEGISWPNGIGEVRRVFDGKAVDRAAIGKVKAVQLIVGSNDTEIPGGGILEWLQEKRGLTKGVDVLEPVLLCRKETLIALHKELKSAYIHSTLRIVDGAGHETIKVLPDVVGFLEAQLRNWYLTRD
jgi:predicted peptidase